MTDPHPWGVYLVDPKTDHDRLIYSFSTESAAREFAGMFNRADARAFAARPPKSRALYFAQHKYLCTVMPKGMDCDLDAEAEGRASRRSYGREGGAGQAH